MIEYLQHTPVQGHITMLTVNQAIQKIFQKHLHVMLIEHVYQVSL